MTREEKKTYLLRNVNALLQKKPFFRGSDTCSTNDYSDDLLYVNGTNHWINGKRIDNPNTHGTGCTFSSAIACNLALTSDKVQAVTNAKEYLAGAIAAKLDLGHGSGPLMHNYKIVEKDI